MDDAGHPDEDAPVRRFFVFFDDLFKAVHEDIDKAAVNILPDRQIILHDGAAPMVGELNPASVKIDVGEKVVIKFVIDLK